MTDEDTFVMPPAWRRALHPRRDRPGVPKAPAPDKAAAGRLQTLVDEADPGSLAGFGRALFERWSRAGAPAEDGWALTRLASTAGRPVPDPDTVHLTALTKETPR